MLRSKNYAPRSRATLVSARNTKDRLIVGEPLSSSRRIAYDAATERVGRR
jgi:hypothetical protein